MLKIFTLNTNKHARESINCENPRDPRHPCSLYDDFVHKQISSAFEIYLSFMKQLFETMTEVTGIIENCPHLRVFLCHSSGDKPSVRDLFKRLQKDGFDPWLDEEKLLPGEDWQIEIPKAVKTSDAVISS